MAVTATWWGCSFISISVETSLKTLRVPSLYPAATLMLSLLEEGLQQTQPQAWPRQSSQTDFYYKICRLGMFYSCTLHHISLPGFQIYAPFWDVFSHLVEDLKLHHQFIAGGWPYPHTAVLTAGRKVALIKAKNHIIHLDKKKKRSI